MIQELWELTGVVFNVPILFVLSIFSLAANPLTFLMAKLALPSSVTRPIMQQLQRQVKGGRRILLAVDETSHEAFEWALHNMLVPAVDQVHLVYVPQGDFARDTYRHSMVFNRSSYVDVLQGVDFLWEYCQKLDLSGVDFDCHVARPDAAHPDVVSVLVARAHSLMPDLVVMGASKLAGR